MVLDLGLQGRKMKFNHEATRPGISLVDKKTHDSKQYGELVELRRKCAMLNSDLNSAMNALSASNMEVEALKIEISRLKDEVKVLRESCQKNQQKKQKRQRTEQLQDDIK